MRAWRGEVENDGYNRLVLGAALTWREITVLRAIGKYLRQARITFSDTVRGAGARRAPARSRGCWSRCSRRASTPQADGPRGRRARWPRGSRRRSTPSRASTRTRSCACSSDVIQAMLRTNYFQHRARASTRRTCRSSSTRRSCAGCRCRARASRSSSTRRAPRACTCAAARWPAAGIRWSDRREDFRTEVLGLMKAQMVKNAVIVPVGAKGGFVVKRRPRSARRRCPRRWWPATRPSSAGCST